MSKRVRDVNFLSFSIMEESSRLNESYDYLFKFLVIGSAGIGKSCLLHQFIEGRFKEDSSHTIGVEFGSKIVPVGGKTVKLQIWDTAGTILPSNNKLSILILDPELFIQRKKDFDQLHEAIIEGQQVNYIHPIKTNVPFFIVPFL